MRKLAALVLATIFATVAAQGVVAQSKDAKKKDDKTMKKDEKKK